MKTAIVLFNLGGPDNSEAVRPFLFNLFNDKAIINLPGFIRTPLAYVIARKRAKVAKGIYDLIGGGSPLLPNTQAQAQALEAALDMPDTKTFIAMRYWHPMSAEVAMAVKEYNPDRILLLPLYPQFSTTTTASSVDIWNRMAKVAKLDKPTQVICCYPTLSGFIDSTAELIRAELAKASAHGKPRILFSAHGLPEKIVAGGDPYQWQCEQTAAAIVEKLAGEKFEHVSCYQSRVGPLKWIGPATDDEINRAGKDGVPLIVVPIAFVSEHSETLVELDIEYGHLAKEAGVPFYGRVPAVGTHSLFIHGVADLVRQTLNDNQKICSQNGGRLCPASHTGCPHKKAR